jgi:hypothetical protein
MSGKETNQRREEHFPLIRQESIVNIGVVVKKD